MNARDTFRWNIINARRVLCLEIRDRTRAIGEGGVGHDLELFTELVGLISSATKNPKDEIANTLIKCDDWYIKKYGEDQIKETNQMAFEEFDKMPTPKGKEV